MTKRYDDQGREIDLSDCPYYRGVGTCYASCYEEPSCITDEPSEGWPSRRTRSDLTPAEADAFARVARDRR